MDPEYDGVLPWVPSNAGQDIQEQWKAGLDFENTFFNEDMAPGCWKPEEVPIQIRDTRDECISMALNNSDMTPHEVEILATRVDRCMLASDSPAEEIADIKQNFLTGDYNVDVPEFDNFQEQTPSMWFSRMTGITPDSPPSKVMDMFEDIAIDGSLANERPSVVAGAMVVNLLGVDEAEQHLCGYDLCDVAAAVDKMQDIL